MENKNTTTSIKNLIITIIFIIFCVVAALGFLWAAFWIVGSAIENISLITSKIDAVIIVALITGCFSVVTVFVSTFLGKRAEYRNARLKYLSEKREYPYEQFVKIVYKTATSHNKGEIYGTAEMITDLSSFSEGITLWGSKKVVEKWMKFRSFNISISNMDLSKNPKAGSKLLLLMEDLINAMRNDLGTKRTKEKSLLSFFVNDIENL